MFESFTRKPFKDSLKDTGFLLKNSFTVVGKEKDIKKPAIKMIIFSLIITTLFYFSILTFLSGFLVGLGIFFIFVAFILVISRFFYDVRQKANMSWIVYNTLVGQEINYADAHRHTASEKGKLRLIAFVDLIVKYASSQRRSSGGIMSIIMNIFLAVLREVWDLLSHYMLPAVVIEQKPLKEIVPNIKMLKNNVPATLVGVFGIDFVGNVVNNILFGVYFFFLAASVGIGFLVALFTEATVIELFGLSFSWAPVLIMMYIISVISGIVRKLVESVKVIYFTIFYTSLTRPMNIVPSMRNEITNYLLMNESDFAPKQSPDPMEKYISQLADYIEQYENSGYSEQEIVDFLVSNNHSEENIQKAISIISQRRAS